MEKKTNISNDVHDPLQCDPNNNLLTFPWPIATPNAIFHTQHARASVELNTYYGRPTNINERQRNGRALRPLERAHTAVTATAWCYSNSVWKKGEINATRTRTRTRRRKRSSVSLRLLTFECNLFINNLWIYGNAVTIQGGSVFAIYQLPVGPTVVDSYSKIVHLVLRTVKAICRQITIKTRCGNTPIARPSRRIVDISTTRATRASEHPMS